MAKDLAVVVIHGMGELGTEIRQRDDQRAHGTNYRIRADCVAAYFLGRCLTTAARRLSEGSAKEAFARFCDVAPLRRQCFGGRYSVPEDR